MKEKKYPRPRKRMLDQEVVTEFLHSIGFEQEKVTQEWRHVTAFGVFKGKEAVFKLASTIATSRHTQNEFYWNEAVAMAKSEARRCFTVPVNYSSGNFGKLFYFIAQRFIDGPLAHTKAKLSSETKGLIKKIAEANREIELLPLPESSDFVKLRTDKEQEPVGHKLLESATEWAKQVPMNLDRFIGELEKAKDSVRSCPAHGDFVLRQMFRVADKIGIIDGEHAGPNGAYHYDVAQLYLRTRIDHRNAELARNYLGYFYELLTNDEKDTFWEELKMPLIQRYIGDLWGAAKDQQKLDELVPLGEEILNDKIFLPRSTK